MEKLKVRITFTSPLLGTSPKNEEIYRDFIGSKAPDAQSVEDEVAALGADYVAEKGMTVFPRLDDGVTPFLWEYQIKGFFKGVAQALKKDKTSKTSGMTAYLKEVDTLIFTECPQNPIIVNGEIGVCQRPLRAKTMQGERVSLAMSEEIPAGSTCEFTVVCRVNKDIDYVREWLDYGAWYGMGQWRNSGKGRFKWEELPND